MGSSRSTSRCHRAYAYKANPITTAFDAKVGTMNLRGRTPAELHAPRLSLSRKKSQHHGQG
nr:hypothetical protein [Tanacetum cinerariifolium]